MSAIPVCGNDNDGPLPFSLLHTKVTKGLNAEEDTAISMQKVSVQAGNTPNLPLLCYVNNRIWTYLKKDIYVCVDPMCVT